MGENRPVPRRNPGVSVAPANYANATTPGSYPEKFRSENFFEKISMPGLLEICGEEFEEAPDRCIKKIANLRHSVT
jgi:hypothetical protein